MAATAERPWLSSLGWALVALLLALAGSVLVAAPARAATVVVSLTFDDGLASAPYAAQQLDQRGMKGTFYINSAMVGTSGYYTTWTQIDQIKANGHEIGGHTLHHVNLTTTDTATATAETCNDRQ